jgi:hypothetical protein
MARVPLRTNCLQAARWWAEAQIFRSLASPRRPPATTGPHSKMPRETTSALIAVFRLLRGPKSSTCRVEITAWAQRALGARNTLTSADAGLVDSAFASRAAGFADYGFNQEPRPSPAGPIDGDAVAGATKASATIGSVASDSDLSRAAIPPQPSGREKRRRIPLLQRRRQLVTIVARRLCYTRLNGPPRHRRLVTPLAYATAPRPDTEDGPADQKFDGAGLNLQEPSAVPAADRPRTVEGAEQVDPAEAF